MMNVKGRTMEPRVERPSAAPAAKKPYHAPELQVYGNIRTLTQSSGAGNADGMGGFNMSGTTA